MAEFSTIKKALFVILFQMVCIGHVYYCQEYIYIYIYIVFDMSTIICMACIEMQKLMVDVLEDFLEANFNPINRVYNSIGVKLRIMMYIDFKI